MSLKTRKKIKILLVERCGRASGTSPAMWPIGYRRLLWDLTFDCFNTHKISLYLLADALLLTEILRKNLAVILLWGGREGAKNLCLQTKNTLAPPRAVASQGGKVPLKNISSSPLS